MLEVDMKTTIKTLYQKGYNKTQIGRMLGIDRKTVRKVLKDDANQKENGQGIQDSVWPSMLDEYREYIEIQLGKELSITRIHQDLQKEFGVECGYTTLRDYVAKLRRNTPHAYMVLHSLPGEEAQVDFGYIGILKVNGSPRKAWVFVMSLSYSRYMYAAITLDQSVQTFIRCHTEAFHYFGGVPQTVKIDNLKAAIVETDFYEPTVQRTYAAFAQHYGFLPNPCRVYTPTDKGKVESNVKYVKDNCFKGRDFADLQEAQRFLSEWLSDTANRRKHGTTGKQPEKVFLEAEKEKLAPLPAQDFIFSKSGSATVRTDCHIVHEGNFYSVP
ncbi:MAG: IS21 family transposase, partial [Lachnospiraceae bacterium]|nr:IS21 family transposase [Lachnospiraceae bacterium]